MSADQFAMAMNAIVALLAAAGVALVACWRIRRRSALLACRALAGATVLGAAVAVYAHWTGDHRAPAMSLGDFARAHPAVFVCAALALAVLLATRSLAAGAARR